MININLIAERRAQKLRQMILMRWSVFGLCVLLLLMVGLNIAQWFSLNSWEAKKNEQKMTLTELQKKRDALQSVVEELNSKGPLVNLLAQVRGSEGAWMTILADVSNVVPQNAFLSNLSPMSAREGVTLRINGHALDEKTVGIFMQSLSQQTKWATPAELSSVNADNITTGGTKTVGFDFSVGVRGLLGGDLK